MKHPRFPCPDWRGLALAGLAACLALTALEPNPAPSAARSRRGSDAVQGDSRHDNAS